ncbi:uncharacterized protein LOC128182131 [Crassostrea angulata]|uniref:uncharacterized protein LOC128182131 n=1 Tax=Magallana angulata TaxID=2784310 RepID=UPI0022B19F4B|nr:uncharacterized protein LOC128182131 [Crassostrea angulata]
MEKAGFETRLRSLLMEYVSTTNTRTMTPVFILQRKHILQLLMFLYGEENFRENGGFSYSKNKDVADQQKKYVLYGYLFIEALKKNTITETDLTTLQRMWRQHLLSLVNRELVKTAEKYERILHDSGETVFNIKRFQRHLEIMKTSDPNAEDRTKSKSHVTKLGVGPFCFRRPRLLERLTMSLKNKFGRGDPRDFLMLKFQDIQ